MATNDRRQAIIDRLVAILGALTVPMLGDEAGGPTSIDAEDFCHNRNKLSKDTSPSIIMLDADEQVDPKQRIAVRGMVENRMGNQVMKMTPEIYVVLDLRSPSNTNVGGDLNTARLAILQAIFTDAQLQAIVGANGNITYDGAVTDLARNRQMQGQMGVSVTFTYPLLSNELQP